MTKSENKFAELYRRVSITSKARYCASRRLLFHSIMSQWTVTLITVGLIAVSVLAISGVDLTFDPKYVSVMQIVFSVLILSYSLLLSLGDYSARSVKLHRCGMELGKIARNLQLYVAADCEDEKYKEFVREYYDCLEKYENHEACDYLEARLSMRPELPAEASIVQAMSYYLKWSYLELRLNQVSRRFLATAHYYFVLGMVYAWIYFLVP